MTAIRPATASFVQDWPLDGLGNFGEFKEDLDGGGWDLDQDRTVSAANEIQTITGGGWIASRVAPVLEPVRRSRRRFQRTCRRLLRLQQPGSRTGATR